MVSIYGEETIKKIIEDYQSGLPLRTVGNKYFISYQTVKNYLKRAGINRRSNKRGKAVIKENGK
jgi:DNA invertase Pin-like site-specific DNA recombinase